MYELLLSFHHVVLRDFNQVIKLGLNCSAILPKHNLYFNHNIGKFKLLCHNYVLFKVVPGVGTLGDKLVTKAIKTPNKMKCH